MGESPIISVVDDDPSVRKAVRRLLRASGFRVECYASAEEFLNSGKAHETACLVLDVRMPGMGGLQLQQQLISSGDTAPIVFISAHDDEMACRRALSAGAVDFLHKPFQKETLLGALRAALAGIEHRGTRKSPS